MATATKTMTTKTATSDSPAANATIDSRGNAFAASPVRELFRGYDTFSANSLDSKSAVSGDSIPGGAHHNVGYRVCTEFSQLTEYLNVDIAAGDVFAGNSVNAKVKMVSKLRFSSYSVAVAVYARNATEYWAADPSCTVKQPESAEEALDFFQRHGDCYVTSIHRGGDYSAVFMFYAESESEQQSVQANLKGKGISEEGKTSGDFSAKLQSAMSSSSTETSCDQAVTGIAKINWPKDDPADMIKFADEFSDQEITNPEVVSFVTQGYEQVFDQSAKEAWQPIVKNREFFLGSTPANGLSNYIAQLYTLHDMVKAIQATYKIYGYTLDTVLAQNSVQIQNDITTMNNLVTQIDQDPTADYSSYKHGSPPAVPPPSLSLGEPNLAFYTAKWPNQGGPDGQLFDDVNCVVTAGSGAIIPDPGQIFVQQGWYLSEISVNGGTRGVRMLTVTYTQGLAPSNKFGPWTHGGGGNFCGTLLLGPGGISGFAEWTEQTRVNSITIFQPGGDPKGWVQPPQLAGTGNYYPFAPKLRPQEGACVLGFHGKQNPDHAVSLGLWYVVFQPARWLS